MKETAGGSTDKKGREVKWTKGYMKQGLGRRAREEAKNNDGRDRIGER